MGIEFIDFNLPHPAASHNVDAGVETEKRWRQIRHEDRPAFVSLGDKIAFFAPSFETGLSELKGMFLVEIEAPGFLAEIPSQGPHVPDFPCGHSGGRHGQKRGFFLNFQRCGDGCERRFCIQNQHPFPCNLGFGDFYTFKADDDVRRTQAVFHSGEEFRPPCHQVTLPTDLQKRGRLFDDSGLSIRNFGRYMVFPLYAMILFNHNSIEQVMCRMQIDPEVRLKHRFSGR